MTEGTSRDLILWFFLSLLIVSILLLGWLLWPFISVIVMGAVVTGVFMPVYRLFTRRLRPAFSSLVTCLLIFVILFVPILFFVTVISGEAYDLYLTARGAVLSDEIGSLMAGSRLTELVESNPALARLSEFLGGFGIELSGAEFQEAVTELAKKTGLILYEQTSAIAQNILKFLVNFFFMLLVTYYLFIDGERLISFIVDLSPLPQDQDEKLLQKFKDMAGAILVGNGLAGVVQGALGGAVFALFGLRSPFLWGLIMAFLAFLPILGIGLVFIPAAVFLLLKGRIGAAIFFVVFYVLVSGGIEYLLKPKLVGSRVQMHTLLVFLAIVGGLKLFGVLGIIYGPLVVTGFLTLTDIYYANYRGLVDHPDG
jgi:predicted PurR-regulated permease PerM